MRVQCASCTGSVCLLPSIWRCTASCFLDVSLIPPSLSLPSEILLKILSYLDAVALLCAGCVNRRFYHLANDK